MNWRSLIKVILHQLLRIFSFKRNLLQVLILIYKSSSIEWFVMGWLMNYMLLFVVKNKNKKGVERAKCCKNLIQQWGVRVHIYHVIQSGGCESQVGKHHCNYWRKGNQRTWLNSVCMLGNVTWLGTGFANWIFRLWRSYLLRYHDTDYLFVYLFGNNQRCFQTIKCKESIMKARADRK